MESRNFYNEILTDHNLHPVHKEDIPDANLVLEGLNPSCGDHIWLKLKVEDGIIKDGGFVGDGCAISQASADIMLDLIIGKKKEEAVQSASILPFQTPLAEYLHRAFYTALFPRAPASPSAQQLQTPSFSPLPAPM